MGDVSAVFFESTLDSIVENILGKHTFSSFDEK